MRVVQLGEHAKLIRGITFKPKDKCNPQDDGAVVCMRTKNVQTTLDESDLIAIPSKLVKNPEKIISIGDILVSSANSWNLVGKCCQVLELQFPSTAGGFISILRPKTEQLYSGYLYRWFSSDVTQSRLRSFGNQTTNISNLDHKRTLKLEIPLPPLADQKRIATILDAADALRAKRRESLAQLESLLHSTFLEMFGDPVTNPMGWELKELVEVCSKVTDGTHDTPPRISEGVPFITSKNVRPFKFDLSQLDYVSQETHEEIIKRCHPAKGDVLYTNIGVNIGNAVRNTLNFEFSLKNVALLQVQPGVIESCFLESLLNNNLFKKELIQRSSKGGAQKFIPLKILRSAKAPIPSFELQTRFSAIVKSIEQQKALKRKHLAELDNLFASLQQRAFKGDL